MPLRCGYRLTSDPIYVNCCHCRDCQQITGSAFAINGMIEADRVELVGDTDPTRLDDRDGAVRCAACGVLLWAESAMFGSAIRFVRLGTLDRSEQMIPDGHFFLRSKHPWIVVPDGVARYETLPTEDEPMRWSEAAQARVAAALAG
jgi:hypothetical protein